MTFARVLFALLVALILVAVSLTLGVRSIPTASFVEAFAAYDSSNPDQIVVREMRLGRAVAALLGGAALGLAGALMQILSRNPLADPGILGINGGAAFGVVVGIWGLRLSDPGTLVLPALAGAALAAILVLSLGTSRARGPDPVRLVLAGAALSALFLSLTWVILITSRQSLAIYRYWVLGGFSQIEMSHLMAVAPLFFVGFALAILAAFLLNPLMLGDATARALGARVGLARSIALSAVVLLCGTTVSLAGPIAFIGLFVPHLVRAFTRPDARTLAVGSSVLGGVLALTADVIGRLIFSGQEIEAGVVIALIGGPALIALVQRRQEIRL
ncbi:MAG: iron ABC transporter permease [Marinovum sp.]|nr:iron ABC transporter permease [Marinovum sp.]